jgi:xylulokinase
MQALADGTGLPVDVSAIPETAALGAAYLARVTAGLEPDTSAATSWSRTAGTVEPRPQWATACDARYATFVDRSA